jgi:hypothetical protein
MDEKVVDVQKATPDLKNWNSGFSVSADDFENLDLPPVSLKRTFVGVGNNGSDGKPGPDACESCDIALVEYEPTGETKSGAGFSQIQQKDKLLITLYATVPNARVAHYGLHGRKISPITTNRAKVLPIDCSINASGH